MAQLRDAIIIGSGPAGYTAAIYLGRAGHSPLVIAGALTPGGQLINTTEVENFPGFPDGVLGPDLMDNMKRQAERFGAEFLQDDVAAVERQDSRFTVTTNQGQTFEAKTVIIATGSSYRKLGVPGEAEFSGRGVSYCATCDGFFFRGKPIVVIGGGDSAFEEAGFLSRFGSSVTIVHRRDEFRASRIMVDRAKENEKISLLTNAVVDEIHGNDQGVQSLSVRDVNTGEVRQVEANGVFVAIGHTPATAFVDGLVSRDEAGYITVDGASTRTNVPGIFAAGDCVDSVYRQAISAAGMGCRAALDAQAYLADSVA
ncbi:thioredoxin-disulfide reductase [Bifidobacterium sp. 64T4]|uniref:thioredoxin-disulfide reductase n=1 Tax=Bifidobacterium pongonis TaxID=2834432 RepID=UPI001C598D0F|nr:thioredoxin-disulfide reductase [Bifidobacterium pongonis]MBW3095552.1 thioredoxin-disulfide reductase [Bifidobacterium pongonis]